MSKPENTDTIEEEPKAAPVAETEQTETPAKEESANGVTDHWKKIWGLVDDGEPPELKEPAKKEEPKPKEEPAPVAKEEPAGDAPKEEPKADPEPKPVHKVEVRRKEPEPLPAPVEQPKAVKPPEQKAPEADPDEGLEDEEREEMALMRYAEAKKPEAYRGITKKTRDFIEKNREEIRKRASDDPDFDPATDEDYRRWVDRNKPQIKSIEKKRLEREMWQDDAQKRMEERLRREREEYDRRLRQIEQKPEIEKQSTTFKTEVTAKLDEDLKQVFPNMEDLEAAKEAVGDIADEIANDYALKAEDFLSITRNVSKFDQNIPSHRFLFQFTQDQARILMTGPAANRIKGGKQFAPPTQYDPATMRDTHWTFSESDILKMLSYQARVEIRETAKRESEKAKRFSFLSKPKQAKKPAPAPSGEDTPPADDPPSPKTGASPSPGAGDGASGNLVESKWRSSWNV